jgi:hypothetical protein
MSLNLAIQITWSNGRSESFAIEGERIRIGTAAYCEIRLPHGEAAPEQVALEDGGMSGVIAQALAASPPATIDGAPFTRMPLLPEATLQIGNNKLRITPVGAVAVGQGRAAQKKSSPLVYVAGAIAIPLAVAQLSNSGDDEEAAPSHEPPALFASASASCPQKEPTAALALAEQQLELANAKRERRPFRAHDGVRAVTLYGTAAACFEQGARADSQRRALSAAEALRLDLEESYRTHRVRLEHALSTKNYPLAHQEVRALRDITSSASGEYVTWLSSLDRRLTLRAGKNQ